MGFARLVALLGPWSCLGLSWGGGRVNLGRGCLVPVFVSRQWPTFDVRWFPAAMEIVACHASGVRGLP